MSRDACLASIGEIAVNWAATEEYVLRLLWLYVGTDRQTFDILFGQQRPSDREKLLKDLVRHKESCTALKTDILLALERVVILRENRNSVLHGAKVGIGKEDDWPTRELAAIREQLDQLVPALEDLCGRAVQYVMARDTAETPLGDESFPGSETELEYEPMVWASKPTKIDPWLVR